MSTILLKADIEEVGLGNLADYSFQHVTRHEMAKLIAMEGFVDKFIQRPLSHWEQETLNDYARLTIEQCCTIIKNSEGKADSSVVNRYKNLPLDFLNEYVDKINLYYIEHQENIDLAFFEKYRGDMDVSSFLDIRSRKGDILNFLDIDRDADQYMKRAFNYRLSRDEIVANALNAKPNHSEEDIVELNKILDEIYNHEINVAYLTECYQKPGVSHSVDDVVRYYNNNHRSYYSSWTDYVRQARAESETALVDVWFKDSFAPRILSFVKGQ